MKERTSGLQALVFGARNLMLDGRQEDVRAVWDARPQGSHLMLLNIKMFDGTMMTFGKVSKE